MRDENHPLLSLKRTDPHSMELIIRPQNPKTITMIRFIQAFSFCFGQLVQKFCPSFALCILAKLSDYLIISHCRRTFWIFILFSSKIYFFRLLYERVPRNKAPLMLHLDDPVVELFKFKPRNGAAMPKTLSDLPMGKYIVCGEARIESQVHQSNCFETLIERLEPDSKLSINKLEILFFIVYWVNYYVILTLNVRSSF